MFWVLLIALTAVSIWYFSRSRNLHWNRLYREGKQLHEHRDLAKAESKLREALVAAVTSSRPDPINTAATQVELARVLHRAGKLAEAEKLFSEGLPALEQRLEPGFMDVSLGRVAWGDLCADLGQFEDAQRHYQQALDWDDKSGNHGLQIVELQRLADLLLAYDRRSEAQAVIERYVELERIATHHHSGETVESSLTLPDLRFAQQNYEEARTLLQSAVQHWDRTGEHGTNADLGRYLQLLSISQAHLGDADRAVESATLAVDTFRREYSPSHPRVAATLVQLSNALQTAGRTDDARAAASEAWEIFHSLEIQDCHPAASTCRKLLGLSA